MSRNSRKRNAIMCVLTAVMGCLLVAAFLLEQKNEKVQEEHIRATIEEDRQKRKLEEEELTVQLRSANYWEENESPCPYEIAVDTNSLADATQNISAYMNNARLIVNVSDIPSVPSGKLNVWRFWASSENEKQIVVFNGSESNTYSIGREPTSIYSVIKGGRLSLEVMGGSTDFGEIIVGDSQIISIDDNSFENNEFLGQFWNREVAKNLVHLIVTGKSSISLSEDRGTFEEIAVYSASEHVFAKTSDDGNEALFVINDFKNDLDENDALLVIFNASRNEGSGRLRLNLNDGEYTAERCVNTQNQEFAFPIANIKRLRHLSISVDIGESNLAFSDIRLYKAYGDSFKFPGGSYLTEPCNEITLDVESRIAAKALACLVDSERGLMYRLCTGSLYINRVNSDGTLGEFVSEVSGLGNSREMIFVKEKKAIAVSSRENGMYLLDISDERKPSITSNYDTLGLATGIASCGDYVAVCGRYFGTEIIDISDLTSPRYCSSVSNIEEFYDCFISEGYLYVSVWANKCIEIYDISNVYDPVYINRVELDGNGGGCFVDGQTLYVALGYCRAGKADNEFDSAFGTGTGLEIFDVSDPTNVKWLSSSMIDGRYFISGFDHWKVTVSGGYAYMSCVSNGLYIYDVKNPAEPKRIQHICVDIPSDSQFYKPLSNVYILPDGGDGGNKEIISDVFLGNGIVYFTGYKSGTFSIECLDACPIEEADGILSGKKNGNKQNVSVQGYETLWYTPETGSVYALDALDDRLYVACGSEGIVILDKNLNLLDTVTTNTTVMDIKVSDGFIYTAEAENGIGIYSINENGLEKVGMCSIESNTTMFSQIQLLGNGKYVLAQAGWTKSALIDVSDPGTPYVIDQVSPGTLYSRNLCVGNLIQGGIQYSGLFSRSKMIWYDENGNKVVDFSADLTAESDGAVAIGDRVLMLSNRGYVLFDPLTISSEQFDNLEHYYVDGIKLRGKPSARDDLLVVSYGYGKRITLVDIGIIESPELIASIEVEGNPDIAVLTEDSIFFPMRREGLMLLRKK